MLQALTIGISSHVLTCIRLWNCQSLLLWSNKNDLQSEHATLVLQWHH